MNIKPINFLLLFILICSLRYLLWFYYSIDLSQTESISTIGLGLTFAFLYQFLSDKNKNDISSIFNGILASRKIFILLLNLNITFILLFFSIGKYSIIWPQYTNLEIELNGNLIEISDELSNQVVKNKSFFSINFLEVNIRKGAFSKTFYTKPFSQEKIMIPNSEIQKDTPESLYVEKLMNLSLFQLTEAKYLDHSTNELASLSKNTEINKILLSRLDTINQLLKLIFIEPDPSDNKQLLIDKLKNIYLGDSWEKPLEALIFFSNKEFDEAITKLHDIDESIKYPTPSSLYFLRGVCSLKAAREADTQQAKKYHQNAINDLQYSEKLARNDEELIKEISLPSALIFQAIQFFYKKDLESAKKKFHETALTTDGTMKARALNGLGFIELITGNIEAAELALLDALEADAEFPYAISNYGYVLLAKNKYKEAIVFFNKNKENKRLIHQSYRDVVLAQLAIAHAKEEMGADRLTMIDEYAKLLSELHLRDFAGIDNEALRLSYIYTEIAEKIYLDKNYYGLEVFALTFFARSYLLLIQEQMDSTDKRVEKILNKSRDYFVEYKNKIDSVWINDSKNFGFFSPISIAAKKINDTIVIEKN